MAATKTKPQRAPKPRQNQAERVRAIFERLAAANPEPKSELESVNDFTFLVAVVLSAQATDAGVNKATRALFKVADTPRRMLDLGLDSLTEQIRTVGLFRTKAKNVIALSEALLRDHGGEVPNSREALVLLPGVGPKTANVVLNNSFGQETFAVDTHVFRVSNRIPIAPGKTPAAVEEGLERLIKAPYRRHAHHWLILHGRYTCVARNPHCPRCVISDLCRWPDKTI